jgi:hypothetical protein
MRARSIALATCLVLGCSPAPSAESPEEATASATAQPPLPTAVTTPSAVPDPGTSATAAPAPTPAPSATAIRSADSKDLTERDLGPSLGKAVEHVTKKEWGKAKKALEVVVQEKLPYAEAHRLFAAHALLGRARAASGDPKGAAESYDTVLKLYAGGSRLAELGPPGDPATQEKVVVVADATSEAKYQVAERKRAQVEKQMPPKYAGKGDNGGVTKFINTEFKKWLTARMKADDELNQLYLAVLDVKPFPAPRWVVRAGHRVGAQNVSFIEELKTAPMPKEWLGSGDIGGIPKAEIRATYTEQLARVSEPFLERARGAHKKCVEIAATFSLKMPEADACAAWLAANPAKP